MRYKKISLPQPPTPPQPRRFKKVVGWKRKPNGEMYLACFSFLVIAIWFVVFIIPKYIGHPLTGWELLGSWIVGLIWSGFIGLSIFYFTKAIGKGRKVYWEEIKS